MREKLAAIDGARAIFSATFERFSIRTSKGYSVPTALFVDVRGSVGEEICDHIWMRKGKQIDALNLEPGDVIKFTATVAGYWSGYHDDRHFNYGLKFPREFRKEPQRSASDALQYELFVA